MSATAVDPFIGRLVLGRYRVIRLLAVGGMGKVYLARGEGAAGFVKPVVVKRLLPELTDYEDMVEMFAREARIMATLQHPGIVTVYDFASEDDGYVLAMEYVHGYALSRWLKFLSLRGELFPVPVALHIAIQVLDALHYAHTLAGADGQPLRVVHRDVTPSNVLIDTAGHVKLLDFGIARTTKDATVPDASGNKVKGKFAYVAPEIFADGEPDAQTDVYSVAVMLHEVLRGRNELYDQKMEKTIAKVVFHIPSRLDTVRQDVSRALADVVARGLAKKPTERYITALEFANALRGARPVGADAAREDTARLAEVHYADPSMATLAGVDLSTLDRAWREYVPQALSIKPTPSMRVAPASPLDQATLRERPEGQPPAGRTWALVAGAATLALGGVGAGLWFATRRTSAPAPQAIYVEGQVTVGEPGARAAADGGAPGAHAAGTAGPGPAGGAGAAGAASAHAGAHSSSHGEVDQSVLLTRTFSRERGRIARCFESHEADVARRGEITLRFEVGAAGHVANVALSPADLSPTGFGACVLQIARAVDFGPQAAPVAFRIPITVRRSGG